MTNTPSNLAHRLCVRPERTLLFTALIGATAAAGFLGCGPPPDSPGRANTSALSSPVGAPPFRDGIYVPINDLLIDSTDGAEVRANGNAALSSVGTAFHDAAVDGNGKLTTFSADIQLHSALTLDVGVSVKGTFASTIDLPPVPLPPFQVGPNVLVTPTAFLTFVIQGSAEGVAHASLVAPFDTGVTFTWQDGKPVIQLDDTPKFKPLAGGPDAASAVNLQVQASVLVGVAFLTNVDGFEIGGPSLQANLGVELDVSPAAAKWWQAYALASLQGGWSFDGTGSATHVVNLAGPSRRLIGAASGKAPAVLPSTRWSRTYPVSDNTSAVAVVPRGNFFTMASAGFASPYLEVLDGQGVPTSEMSIDALRDGTDQPTGMVRAPNGDLTVAATVAGAAMRLDRYDSAGKPLWARFMNRPSGDFLVGGWNAITGTDDGGVVVGGSITTIATRKTDLVLAQIDSAGNTVWLTEVDLGAGTSSPGITAISREASGNILVVGSVVYGDKPGDPTATIDRGNALILRIDPQGNVLGAHAVGGVGGEAAYTVATTPDGRYAIGGEVPTQGLGRQSHGAWLAMFGADDTLTASMTYAGENQDLGQGDIQGIAVAPGGGLLVAGNVGYNHNAWIMRVGDTGMPEWFKSLRGVGSDVLQGIVPLADGLVAFGSTSSLRSATQPGTDTWLARTNVDGMLDFTGTGGFDAVNDVVGWESTIGFVSVPLAPIATIPALSSSAALFDQVTVTPTTQLLTQ
jgi:hypothetical protein